MGKKPSLGTLILDYFKKYPNQDLSHNDWVDEITAQYKELYGKNPRDPWRAVRKFHENGILIKAKKGIYRYDPDSVEKRELEDFTPAQKQLILERDEYKCVICGLGEKEGMELHVDHIMPKNLGGKAIIENGQTLCARHNNIKKKMKQTETGKKMFITLRRLAQSQKDTELVNFCEEVLGLYEKYKINGHITWGKNDK